MVLYYGRWGHLAAPFAGFRYGQIIKNFLFQFMAGLNPLLVM
jgi:hypothetical protein